MPLNRTSTCVAAGLLALALASPAMGDGPLGMQLFAEPDVSTFGGSPPPNDGYFFSFDELYWAVQVLRRFRSNAGLACGRHGRNPRISTPREISTAV